MPDFLIEKRDRVKRPFIWMTAEGECLLVTQMRSGHLYNCVKMLWNHTVPERFRMAKFVKYSLGMPMKERTIALRALLTELHKRKDLLPHEVTILNEMVRIAREHLSYRLE